MLDPVVQSTCCFCNCAVNYNVSSSHPDVDVDGKKAKLNQLKAGVNWKFVDNNGISKALVDICLILPD